MLSLRSLATGLAALLVCVGAAQARGHPMKAGRVDNAAAHTSKHGRYQSHYVATHLTAHTVRVVPPRLRHPRK